MEENCLLIYRMTENENLNLNAELWLNLAEILNFLINLNYFWKR